MPALKFQSHSPGAFVDVSVNVTISGPQPEVGDEDAEMLRYFAELGLFPETPVEVLSVAPFEGPLTLLVGGSEPVR